MKLCSVLRRTCCFVVCVFVAFAVFEVGAKPIRLRSPIFPDTHPNFSAAKTSSAKAPASSLYLIQFRGPLRPEWRAQLTAAGVDLLQYIPDDTFLARLGKASPETIQQLPYVEWVGVYGPEHKLQKSLRAAAASKNKASLAAPASVTVLLAPRSSAAEIASAKALFASLRTEDNFRFGTVLHGKIAPDRLNALAQSDAVLWIEPAPKRKLHDEAASKIVGGDDGKLATPTVTEQSGFDGSGVTICVADTGLDSGNTNTMHPDLRGRVTGFQFYGDNIFDGSDGYGHGTHCAGIIAGNAATGETDPDTGQWYGLGVASGADLFVERIFDDEANEASPFPSDSTLTSDAVRAGAQIGANSWGDDVQGEYNIDAATFDELVRDADPSAPGDQPYILEFSAGNAGPDSETMDSPASAKNVIATGASENDPGTYALTYGLYAEGRDSMADFSSRGPCQDGRIKPDLVAPGTWIASLASSAAPSENSIAWSPIDNYYVYMGGTSMAGPHAAGAAAVFVQYYKTLHTNAVPSPALVKAALINSADELDQANGGPGPVPNNDEGWGRVDVANLIVTNFDSAPRVFQYLDQTVLLTNSEVYSQHIFVRSSDQPLKITLAYTDVPGFPGAIPALVNDLDLEVVAPDGTLYRGNQFGAGESVPNAPTPDKINNVEGIYLSQPAPGDYLVRVRGSAVVQDARDDTPAIDQDFALVSSADFARPGTGLILLDRPSYTAPDKMQIEVFDPARAAKSSVSVLVTNLTRQSSENTVLRAAGNYGVFTGVVATVTGTAGAGQIQIANGDHLEVDYLDSGGIGRSATAVADLVPPAISSVASGANFGVLTISWQTSEPATSIVHYGTNSANLNLGATNLSLVTSHSVKLTGLIPGQTYYYTIISADGAENVTTADNSGAHYTFVGVTTPTVLLVDDYDTTAESANGSTVIPDSAYTNVLAAANVSYAFWKVIDRGSPQLADLKPFPVVIWRTTDDLLNYGADADGLPDPSATNNTLNAQQQFMIQNYLNGGGSFFMASMNILENVGDTDFRRDVLQVARFKQNPDPPLQSPNSDEDFGVPAVYGEPASVADGVDLALDYSNYPSFNFDEFSFGPDFSDVFTPSSAATPILFESESGKTCGISYPKFGVDTPGRVVFLSFPLDTMPTNGAAPNNSVSLMRKIIAFLAPGANGQGEVLLDNTVYTTNDVLTVEVGDSDLAGAGQTQVSFQTSSRTNRVTVTLFETTHPGLFRGTLALIAGNANANQLQVANGDTINATYFDSSNNRDATATASIDTVPPVISNVSATTDYYNAQVTWQTSKPSDSSVQYGALSQPPVQVIYAGKPVTSHSVTISGLLANRVYNYQVVSRDQAGNTTVDDNNGKLYTFQTLKAPTPPWSDDLESGSNGWTVVPDPQNGSDLNWAFGTPQNGLTTSAHSGVNTWGSDLNGNQNFTLASSYLYSPVIDLTGLKSATLTFWDVCDFSRVDPYLGLPYEDGIVYVSTNSSTSPLDLPVATDFVDNAAYSWQKETVDLTPYVGQTIQVVFYYEGVPIGDTMYGWTIDDISVTGAVEGGNISITKNLDEGNWTLSSLSSIGLVPVQSGTAPSITISNLPAADYVVQFGDVPYYQTPASQTNTLKIGETVDFTGNYTFLDANNNGISDAWEQDYFGAVATNRTQATDTDGDGMSDYAEFVAGTDPTNANSKFEVNTAMTSSDGDVSLSWATAPGRAYRIYGSANAVTWTPVSDWIQTTAATATFALPPVAPGGPYLFRVEVQP